MRKRKAASISGKFFLCSAMAASAFAQNRTAVPRPPNRNPDRITKDDCPAVVPPTTSDSVATAIDFIELRRTGCAGSCPAYQVRISGDGSVSWLGEKFVELKGSATDEIPSIDARVLMQRVADRGFWALCGRYSRGPADSTAFYTTLSIAGHIKRVQDTAAAAPSWLRMMDEEIDQVADTHRWRHGEPDKETFGDDRLRVDVSSPKTGVTRLMKVAAAQPDTGELRDMIADTSLDLNARDSSGWTALMYAAQSGTLEAVSHLLQARANPFLRSNEGETAIFAAVSSSDRPDLKVRLLRSAGAEINWQDNRGVTPLMIAVRHSFVPNLIATLIQLGADPTKRDIDGRNAGDYLAEQEKVRPDPSNSYAIRALLVSK